MKRYQLLFAALIGVLVAGKQPVAATFHVMVIDEVFFGLEEVPEAQYVDLRLQAPVQTQVFGQPIYTADATGTTSGFAAFCSTPRSQCNLPVVSPACKDGGCPNALEADGHQILVATRFAQGLFCVTADLLATGTIPYPDGRVCFGDCGPRDDCAVGPVDCVAYGNFTGDNGIFGQPKQAPALGSTLASRAERTNQFIGGNLLDSASGFEIGVPAPINFHGDAGSFDGIKGDANGDGSVGIDDVSSAGDAAFAGGTRCALPAAERGADANLDTRVSAADVVAVIQLALAS